MRGPLKYLAAYGVAVNAGAAGLFYYDKQQAILHKWRVRESTLQLTALAGGWIGGMWAMQQFKHKRAKQSFKNVYFAAVGGNVGIIALGTFLFFKKPHLLPAILRPNQQQINQFNNTMKQTFNNNVQQQHQQQKQYHQHSQQQQTTFNQNRHNNNNHNINNNKNNIMLEDKE
ncbi:hypothetical protein PPL_06221 [Heterostelium album PN500]|uniref:Transmembrane protein n=1 Tax=Heterostelium pallidum (strain ATCC 26659 / Pp 5 / PN500) TaxID=670386 RepID=D3BCJ6_HETP5|nr:hypothetical protein PPL_06221 [Heterostelium album PN500]EFA80638.1 hypothetical protein PPL_06221 [Heterostelium album PN500]|eukprot:XP_020432758.1 hypothetical protein PPL_06221 [Heterostelium album PN500]